MSRALRVAVIGSGPGAALPVEVTGYGVRSLLYTKFGATLGRSTIYLIIIILLISLLRTLLLSPFVLIWLRKCVYRVSDGGVNARGHLGVCGGLRPCCTPVESSTIHAFENIRVNIECSHR